MPDGTLRTHIPLGLALALGRALGLEPREVEAHEIRPRPARFTAPRHGLPVIAAREDPVTVTDAERPAVAA